MIAFTLIGGLLRLWSFGRLGLVHFDEGIYAAAGLWIFSRHGILDLDPSVIAYAPPGFPFLIGMAYFCLGAGDLSAILVSIVVGHAHNSGGRLAGRSYIRQRGRGGWPRRSRPSRALSRVLAHGPHRRIVPACSGCWRWSRASVFWKASRRAQGRAPGPGRRRGPALQIQRLARRRDRRALCRRLAGTASRPVAVLARPPPPGDGALVAACRRCSSSTGPGSPSSSHTAVTAHCWPTSAAISAASRPGPAISRSSSHRARALSGGPIWLASGGLAAGGRRSCSSASKSAERRRRSRDHPSDHAGLAALRVTPDLAWWVPLVWLPGSCSAHRRTDLSKPVIFVYAGWLTLSAPDAVLPPVRAALAASRRRSSASFWRLIGRPCAFEARGRARRNEHPPATRRVGCSMPLRFGFHAFSFALPVAHHPRRSRHRRSPATRDAAGLARADRLAENGLRLDCATICPRRQESSRISPGRQ